MYLYAFLKFLHLVGLSVGYGGVLFAALLSARSMKDSEYFKSVAKVMPFISMIMWGGLILLAASGVFLEDYWRTAGLNLGQKFPELMIKKILVLAIVLHGIYVNLYLGRKMAHFGQAEKPFEEAGFKKFKILGMIGASVSLTLWTVVVILGIWMTSKIIL